MGRIILSVLLVVVVGLSMALFLYSPIVGPGSKSVTVVDSGFVGLGSYSGWRGVESVVAPLDEYVRSVRGSGVYFSVLVWPLADARDPFYELLDRGSGLVVVTVLSVDRVYRYNIYAYVVYSARVDRVVVKPGNTIGLPPQAVCEGSLVM